MSKYKKLWIRRELLSNNQFTRESGNLEWLPIHNIWYIPQVQHGCHLFECLLLDMIEYIQMLYKHKQVIPHENEHRLWDLLEMASSMSKKIEKMFFHLPEIDCTITLLRNVVYIKIHQRFCLYEVWTMYSACHFKEGAVRLISRIESGTEINHVHPLITTRLARFCWSVNTALNNPLLAPQNRWYNGLLSRQTYVHQIWQW